MLTTNCIFFFTISAVIAAQPPYFDGKLRYNQISHPLYNFAYGVDDELADNKFSHKESRDGAGVKGTYQVLLPDRRNQRVNYLVDGDSGFLADVQYDNAAQFASNVGVLESIGAPYLQNQGLFGNADLDPRLLLTPDRLRSTFNPFHYLNRGIQSSPHLLNTGGLLGLSGGYGGFSGYDTPFGNGAPLGYGTEFGHGTPLGYGTQFGVGTPLGIGTQFGIGTPLGIGTSFGYGMPFGYPQLGLGRSPYFDNQFGAGFSREYPFGLNLQTPLDLYTPNLRGFSNILPNVPIGRRDINTLANLPGIGRGLNSFGHNPRFGVRSRSNIPGRTGADESESPLSIKK